MPGARERVRVGCSLRNMRKIDVWLELWSSSDVRAKVTLKFRVMLIHG